MKVTLAAPAKINLWLRIGERLDSGFHHIDTLFCALHLADTISVSAAPPGQGVRLHAAAAPPLARLPDLGPETDNLAVRAAVAFADRTGRSPDVDVHLVKRIPAAGGLGGGSADAAGVLRALARLHPGALDGPGLLELAATLGSDVPFCACGHALARGAGRGTRLRPLTPLPRRPLVIVMPPFGIATADAYRWLDDDRAAAPGASPGFSEGDASPRDVSWDDVAAAAVNDFEAVAFRKHPLLAGLRDDLANAGARPALMAGTGSTLFGVFDDEERASAAAEVIRSRHPDVGVLVTRTRPR